jgi:hypothetical protein
MNPFLAYIKVIKRVLQYLKGTKYLNIVYGSDVNNDELMKLHGFFDFDFVNDLF